MDCMFPSFFDHDFKQTLRCGGEFEIASVIYVLERKIGSVHASRLVREKERERKTKILRSFSTPVVKKLKN